MATNFPNDEIFLTTEEVLDDGQKLQFARNVNIVARMPDRLLAEIDGDILKRLYVYDGKTFTGAALRAGYYATVAAPPSIGELVDFVNKSDIDLPLVDLFLWGGPRSDTKAIRSAVDVGPGRVAGVSCQHYALRQPGLDWQIWIQLGDHPLPRKLVLTTTDDEARPQFSAIINWNLAPSFGEGTFTFVPPPGVVKAVFSGDKAPVGKKK